MFADVKTLPSGTARDGTQNCRYSFDLKFRRARLAR